MKRLLAAVLSMLLVIVLCACASQIGPYTITRNGTDFLMDPEDGTISDGRSTYFYQFSGHTEAYSITITYPNGSSYWFTRSGNHGHGGWSDDYSETAYIDGDTLCQVVLSMAPTQANWGKSIWAMMLIAIGLFQALRPEQAWYWAYGWRYKHSEPSDDALLLARVSAIAAVVLGIVLLLN